MKIKQTRVVRAGSRTSGLFLALALLSLTLLPAGAARAGLFNPDSFTLANGMQVVVISDHRAPVVTQMVWYKVGAADEPQGKSGVAHLLEHLMFKGTERFGAGVFSDVVAKNGGRENAFTSTDYTGYFQTVAVDRLETIMELEADRMVNLTLTEEQILSERDVVLEERRSRVDNDPSSQLSEQMTATQFLAYPYRKPVIGWHSEVSQLTLKDALDFYGKHYAPSNAILIVAGDVTVEQVRPLAEKYYGAIATRDVPPRLRTDEPPQLAARRLEMSHPRVPQPIWRRSYLAPSVKWGESEHALPLTVLAEIIGGGATSRFYRSLVVEKKLAAQASAFYGSSNLGPSRFFLVGVPVNGGNIEEVEAEMLALVERVAEEGITEAELERAKNGMLASAIYARDSVQGAARTFGAALAIGRTIEDVESWPDRVEAITVEDVNAAARFIFDEAKSVTAVLLPKQAS
jgi:zinc protease